MEKFNKAKKILFFTLALFGMSMQLQAALITYNGGGADPTDWNDGANWVGGIAPGPTDDALISGGAATLSVTFTVASLEISSGADIIIDAGAVLNLGGDDGTDTNGAFDISSGSATVINNGTINVTNAAEDGIDHRGQSFINNGVIVINGFGNDGLSVEDTSSGPGTFTNNGSITVIATGGGDDLLQVDDGSSIINAGTITVSSSDCTGDMGLNLDDASFFTNTATGVLLISDVVDESIFVEPGSVVDNSGLISSSNTGQCSGSGNHGLDIRGTFINNVGGTYKDVDPRGDNIRGGAAGVFVNLGTLVLDLAGNTSDGIDTEDTPGLAFSGNGVIEIGCDATINEIEINGDLDLGAACINFDITSTGSGGTDYDRIENKNGTVTIGAATAKIDWGTFVPEPGDCFKIVDGQTTNVGLRSGEFVAITSSNPAIAFDIDYSDPAEVEICVIEAALPVSLTYFEGRLENATSHLNWETASELNNDYFEIEHATDGRTFSTIDMVNGNGTSNVVNQYRYIDKNPSTHNYYRLKQVDFDGAFEYSNIVYLENKGNDAPIAIYPNPAQAVLNYNGAAATLAFYDNAGRKVLEKIAQGDASFDISHLEAGFYTIEITSATNEKSFERFVISK